MKYPMQITNVVRLAITLIACVLLVGCQSEPKPENDTKLPASQFVSVTATDYWKWHNVPKTHGNENKSVAIVDFGVEYVTAKIEPELTNQMATSSRKQIRFTTTLYKRLADEMYIMFTEHLKGRGLNVVSTRTITSSNAYQRFSTTGSQDSTLMQILSPTGSDTGRIKKMTVRPAPGLRLITGARNEEVEEVEADLLSELDADIALRVRIRVSVYRGYASLDRGSTIWVLSNGIAGNLTADRSLISDELVIDKERYKLSQGKVYAIDSAKYLAVMHKLFPTFVEMAFNASPKHPSVR